MPCHRDQHLQLLGQLVQVLGGAFDLPRRCHILSRDLLDILYCHGDLIHAHHLLLCGNQDLLGD